MILKIYERNLFAKLFTFGLLLLFVTTLTDSFRLFSGTDLFIAGSRYIFAAGITICAVSFLFLLIEWMTLPFGIQTKRIKLYQGAGNLLAFLLLAGGYIIKTQTAQVHADTASMMLSSSGLAVALLFSSVGSSIAAFISRKKIKLYGLDRNKLPLNNKSIVISTLADAKTLGETIVSGVSQNRAAQN